MPTLTTVSTVSRSEFEQLAHRGLGGDDPLPQSSPATEQWHTEHPDWRGRHWIYTEDEPGVLRLTPLNVTRNTAQRSTAA